MILSGNQYSNLLISRYRRLIVGLCLLLSIPILTFAQNDSLQIDPALVDSLTQFETTTDSLRPWEKALGQIDTTGLDSLAITTPRDSIKKSNDPLSKVKVSKDGLDLQLDYSAADSSVYDLKNEIVHLYGNAVVKYDEYNLTAGYITFSWSSNEVTAQGIRDSITNRLSQIPVFTDKSQKFEAEHIRFNFKTRKGIVKNVVTKQGEDLFVLGAKAKITSTEKDTTREDIVYSQDAIFTTCNHPVPHYGIRSKKQKIIANKFAIVGPSNLEISGIPSPLGLPFGVYPLTNAGSTGLIFPRDIQNDQQLGFGLKGVGWFFPLGEYFNLQVTGDYYVRGTWGLNLRSDYKRRYRYSGYVNFNFSSLVSENAMAVNVRSNPLKLVWSHSMDSKAHPTINFSANVNFATNKFNQTFERQATQVQNNQLTSNITFNKSFTENKFKFTASLNLNQNTRDSTITVNFPNLLFTTGNFKPFKNKSGNDKWYENFTFSYRGETKTTIKTKDEELFTQETLDEAQFGMKHTITGAFNATILKYINFNVSTSFSENIYLKSFEQVFDPTVDTVQVWEVLSPGEPAQFIRTDTLSYGTVIDSFTKGFTAFHNLRPITAGLSTKVFSTILFKKGNLRGVRNVTAPNIGFSYSPNYEQYFGEVDTDVRPEFNMAREFSRLQGAIYDRPSSPDRRLQLTYGFTGNVEAKVHSKKTKEDKRIKLIEQYSFSSSYDFEKESMKFNTGTVSARTTILNKSVQFRFSSTLNFYQFDPTTNQRVDKLLWKEERRLFEASRTALVVTGNTSVRKLIDIFQKNETQGKGDPGSLEALLDNFTLRYNLGLNWTKPSGRDTFFINNHTIDINGNLKLTEKWRVGIGQIGYNFTQNRITYPDFSFSYDLHCWEMSVSWYPNANAFGFTLGVKPGTLDFIKVPYQRSNFERGTGQF